MIPTPGRIVEYTLSAQDAQRITDRRGAGGTANGNPVREGDTYPLVITRVWGGIEGSACNGQVLLDGPDTLWVTSVTEGDGAYHWRPFPRV